MSQQQREEKYGRAAPVITQSYAGREIVPGDTWRVYLNASDPDGDMQYVIAVLSQPGGGDYSPSYTRIPKERGKDLSGYIYLNTLFPEGYEFLTFYTLTLTVNIKDKAGHLSAPAVFPVTFNPRAVQEPPPPGIFEEVSLGPVMITVHPFDSEDRGIFR